MTTVEASAPAATAAPAATVEGTGTVRATVMDSSSAVFDAREHALARLVASRARLSESLGPARTRASSASASGAAKAKPWDDWIRLWRDRLRGMPALAVAVDAAEAWWRHSPWRMAGQAVADEVDGAITPWMRKHPLLGVALAAGLGYVVVASRPWSWPIVAEQLRPLPRRATRWLLRALTDAPLQSILVGFLFARQGKPSATTEDGGSEPKPTAG